MVTSVGEIENKIDESLAQFREGGCRSFTTNVLTWAKRRSSNTFAPLLSEFPHNSSVNFTCYKTRDAHTLDVLISTSSALISASCALISPVMGCGENLMRYATGSHSVGFVLDISIFNRSTALPGDKRSEARKDRKQTQQIIKRT